MMTHRSKKPFECTYEGCDKSYCDARSLRRHLENHHQATLEAAAGSAESTVFQFDPQYRQQFTANYAPGGHVDPQRSPGYLNQVSPISPAPGCQPPGSPIHRNSIGHKPHPLIE